MIETTDFREIVRRRGVLTAGQALVLLEEIERLTAKLDQAQTASQLWQPVRDLIQTSSFHVGLDYPNATMVLLKAAYEVAKLWPGIEACTTTYSNGSMELDEALERLDQLMGSPR